MNRMLTGGARWAVEQGYGRPCDLDRIEEGGMADTRLTPFRIERVSASGTRWAGSAQATIIWKCGR
jgi:tRNA-splicing ligase RtcB